jgi:hypothetical protein
MLCCIALRIELNKHDDKGRIDEVNIVALSSIEENKFEKISKSADPLSVYFLARAGILVKYISIRVEACCGQIPALV